MSTSEKLEIVCRLPSSRDLEIVLREIADELALLIGDERVDFDVFDLRLEGGGLRCGCRWRLARGDDGAGQKQKEPRNFEPSMHKISALSGDYTASAASPPALGPSHS